MLLLFLLKRKKFGQSSAFFKLNAKKKKTKKVAFIQFFPLSELSETALIEFDLGLVIQYRDLSRDLGELLRLNQKEHFLLRNFNLYFLVQSQYRASKVIQKEELVCFFPKTGKQRVFGVVESQTIINSNLNLEFYQDSTMQERVKMEEEQNLGCSEIILNNLTPKNNSNSSNFLQYTRYLTSMVQMANLLSSQLLKNNELISHYLNFPSDTPKYGEKSMKSTQYQENSSVRNDSDPKFSIAPPRKEKQKRPARRRRKMRSSDEQSYSPDAKIYGGNWSSQSFPKNYGKSIVCFIESHPDYVAALMKHLNLPEQQFSQSFQSLKQSIETISDVRPLWIDSSQNKYAKAYRILSMQYLRKHYLGYIYNFRSASHHKHIKYRHMVMRSIRNPEQYPLLKVF